jgi:hypothetical protein
MVFWLLLPSWSHTMRSHLVHATAPVLSMIRRGWNRLCRVVLHPGRHDLFVSMLLTASVLAPVWTRPVAAQVGVSATEEVLCTGAVNIAQLVTIGLGMVSMYFILKGVVRIQLGVDNAGAIELRGSDGVRRTDAAGPYGRRQARGGLYSISAALLPVLVPVFLSVAGVNVVSCLFP